MLVSVVNVVDDSELVAALFGDGPRVPVPIRPFMLEAYTDVLPAVVRDVGALAYAADPAFDVRCDADAAAVELALALVARGDLRTGRDGRSEQARARERTRASEARARAS